MRKNIFILIVLMCLGNLLTAQDIHFSQYYSSPLTVNPAQTGMLNGSYRVGANFRTQWASVTVPYKTFAAYGDFNFLNQPFNKGFGGAGLSIIRDQAGDGNLTVTKVTGCGAYHLAADGARKYYLSFGLQASYIQKRIDWSKLYFHSQWDDIEFNQSRPSYETGYKSSFIYFDFQIGALYSFIANEKVSGYASASLYHALRPKDSFYENDFKLGGRPQLSAGATVNITDAVAITPSFYYQNQKNASELLTGIMASYAVMPSDENSNKFYFGTYLRIGDAFYPVAGYEFQNIRVLLNYDVNYSELKPASDGRGALEISIVYTGARRNKGVIDIPCPRF